MDGFCEQVVKKRNSAKQKVFSVMLIVLFALIELLFIFLYTIEPDPFWLISTFIVGIVAVGLLCLLLPRINVVDFDYSVSGNKLRIDKVINKSSRKKYLEVEINQIEDMDVIGEGNNIPAMKFSRTKDCSDGNFKDSYYCVYKEIGRGKCLLIFSPNEKIIQGMRPAFNHDMMVKYTRRK